MTVMLNLSRTGNVATLYVGMALVISMFQPVYANCGDKATRISKIQGSSLKSPLIKQTHTIEAMVIGVFQDNDALKGFFVQEEMKHWDKNPLSSEGIFVFYRKTRLKVGQIVRLRGQVQERFGQTQLSNVDRVVLCEKNVNQLPNPVDIDLPFKSDHWLEAFEGMLVRIQGDLTVTDNSDLGKFGEFVVANKYRLFTPTQVVLPGKEANTHASLNELNQLIIDDGSSKKYPRKLIYPAPELSALNTLRIGQKLRPIVGVLSFAFGRYRVHPTAPVAFKNQHMESQSARPQFPEHNKKRQVRVAAFNVDNYFNGDGQGGGFPSPRGADSYSEFKRQSTKLGRALSGLGAHIIGIAELENDGYGTNSAIASLTNATNSYARQEYRYIVASAANLGKDAITVGFLYQTSAVTPVGKALTMSSPPFNELGRQPLAQTFAVKGSEMQITVVVTHFKSKTCRGATDDNLDQGDGQACFNPFRTAQAKALTKWIAKVAPSSNIIVLGDLNSYIQEDPIKVFLDSGYYLGFEDQRLFKVQENYSYVYKGQTGVLDYALYHKALKPYFKSLIYWHINADEPRVLDYNTENKTDSQRLKLFNDDPYRSSDHDPVYLILEF